MAKEYQIGALWIGGSLSFLEQLCLKSFADAGHHVKLFTYGEVLNIPDGIEIADANSILSMDSIIRHSRTGSPAPQADRFRYHMLAQTDDIIWADTDAYCVKPFVTENGHFYGWESPHHVNNGVLGLPKDSDTLDALISFTSDEFAIPEWLPQVEQNRLQSLKDSGEPVGVGDQEWGAWGPRALTHFLHKTGEIKHALPVDALYPIGFKNRGLMVRPGANAERFITPDTMSIHFYGRRMRERIMNEGGEPADSSLIGRLLKKHGVTPSDAPLPKAPPKLEPIPAAQKRGRGVLNLTDLADSVESDRGSARHGYTDLYQMLLYPMRTKKIQIVLVGLDGGIGLETPNAWADEAEKTLSMWLDYFPKAKFTALDHPKELPSKNKRVTYHQVDLNDPADIAASLTSTDLVIDDATHASHHQQNALRALFPKLTDGGLYIIEDLRTQPASQERQGQVKTAALFNEYLEKGVFELSDAAAKAELNELRADISGCFLFQAKFQKHRRDQMLVLHKR